MEKSKKSRRGFIKTTLGTALITGVTPALLGSSSKIITLNPRDKAKSTYAANYQINIAVIGMGIMGFSNAETSLQVPGVKLVAVCDLYTGRLERAKEVFGKDLYTT